MKRIYDGHMTKCKIFIHNVPMPKDLGLYTAVRLSENEFYFFGTYDTEEEAKERLKKQGVRGFVIQTRGMRKEKGKEWKEVDMYTIDKDTYDSIKEKLKSISNYDNVDVLVEVLRMIERSKDYGKCNDTD